MHTASCHDVLPINVELCTVDNVCSLSKQAAFFIFFAQGDAGLTGRKIIVDTYGPVGSTWRKGSFQGGQVYRLRSEVDCEIDGKSWTGKESDFTGKEDVGCGTATKSNKELLEIVKKNFDLVSLGVASLSK